MKGKFYSALNLSFIFLYFLFPSHFSSISFPQMFHDPNRAQNQQWKFEATEHKCKMLGLKTFTPSETQK